MDVYLRWVLVLGCFMMWMMRGMGGMSGGNRSRDMRQKDISNLGGQTGVDQLRIAQLEREVEELRAVGTRAAARLRQPATGSDTAPDTVAADALAAVPGYPSWVTAQSNGGYR